MKDNRRFLKADWAALAEQGSDQKRRMPYPALEQPFPEDAELLALPEPAGLELARMPLIEAVNARESRRKWSDGAVSLDELAMLLWTTQGVRHVPSSGAATLRTVPSGGARHTFETYLAIDRVAGLKPGLYRYIALRHKLWCVREDAGISLAAGHACLDQRSVSRCSVTFIWSTVPYRAEWRYGPVSHKMIAIDAGHVCQNLYLACEAMGLGCCAIGAYDQQLMDTLCGLDGADEFAVYAAAVGKPA